MIKKIKVYKSSDGRIVEEQSYKVHKFYLVCGRVVHMHVISNAYDDPSCFWYGRVIKENTFANYEFTSEYAHISDSKICMFSLSFELVKEFKGRMP